MDFDQADFNEFARVRTVVSVFPEERELKSGRKSRWYVNWRDVISNTFDLETVARYILDFVKKTTLEPDCFIGVPEGATKLGFMTNYFRFREGLSTPFEHILPMFRVKPKTHGDPRDRYFVGSPKGKVIILEDVTTIGLSLLERIAELRELEDANVIAAISLTNRMELTPIPGIDEQKIVDSYAVVFERATGKVYDRAISVKEAISYTGIPFYWLSNGPDLLKQIDIPDVIAKKIEEEFKRYGIQQMRLRK